MSLRFQDCQLVCSLLSLEVPSWDRGRAHYQDQGGSSNNWEAMLGLGKPFRDLSFWFCTVDGCKKC